MSSTYYYGQDGLPVTTEIITIFDLSSKEYRYSDKLQKDIFDFVGFVFRRDKILVVFPKHYYGSSDLNLFNLSHDELHEDIRLLFDVIQQYDNRERTAATAKSYMGAQTGFDSDYPFKAFYEVYSYYQKYGLYKVKSERIIEGTIGRISWKYTLSKSNKIISDGNLIFSPFYVKKRNFNNVFLTECMAFIIDYTLDTFRDFLSLKRTGYKYKFDFFSNKEYVLQRLKEYQNAEYKDINKKMINSMIDFFCQYDSKSHGGNAHIRIRYFDMVWQKMILSYINRHFIGISTSTGEAVFDISQAKSVIAFNDAAFDDIDLSHHNFSIDVDHLAFDNGRLFIFDSKYYSIVDELNYKQLAYNELLRYHFSGTTEIHNILFLPGEDAIREHFKYAPDYVGPRRIGLTIMEQYIHPKKIMRDYVK